jgi:hypothetical protein
MNTKYAFVLLIILLGTESLLRAAPFRTEIYSPKIQTLRIRPADDPFGLPIIDLEGGQFIEVSFDELTAQPHRYVYTVTHCNADWNKSQLIAAEYMSGFQQLPIEEYSNSFNTTMDYVNYKIYFPNPDLTLKVSGNYAVHVFSDEDMNSPLLTACFSITEPLVDITNAGVTPNTDIDFNATHQQVSFDINYKFNTTAPLQEFKVYVQQNNRKDNMAALVQPQLVRDGRLEYTHNKDLIFNAGNEYRRFEMISSRNNGLNIYRTEYHAPYFHVELYPDEIRAKRSYRYDEDINGRFFIRSEDGVDYDYEADYFFVHFSLPREEPYLENIYLLSEIFHNIPDERSQLKYNYERKTYEMSLLLKQGAYNYLYVTKNGNKPQMVTDLIEGNYFQTENEYTVYVYHRPFGGRYDKLVGWRTVRYQQ